MRLQLSKSKNATSLYIVQSFRNEKGHNTSKVVRKLGTLESLSKELNGLDPIAWGKQIAAEMTAAEKEGKLDISIPYSTYKRLPLNEQRLFNGGYLFLQSIYHQLGLDKIANTLSKHYKFTFDFNDILKKLVYTRILHPSSKRSSFEISNTYIEGPLFDQHQIYRALEVIAKETDFIESQVYKNSTSCMQRNTSILYYDCTNFFFEIEEANGLKQYGKSKENRPNPIVQMGLFMDGNGLPLTFTLTPGNTNEQITLKPLEEKIMKDFSLSQFIVCTDGGLSSIQNRKFNAFGNRAFITVQSLKKIKGHLRDYALEESGWRLANGEKIYNLEELEENEKDCVYYKERWIKENGLEQRLIITFSPKYKAYQQAIREKQIDRATLMVEKQKSKQTQNPSSPRRFIEEHSVTEQGELADKTELHLNEGKIKEEAKYDGFYAVCTNLEDPIEKIIEINQRRWEIEESFQIMKSEFKTRPVYLQKDTRIQAHFTSCFLSLLIFRILEKKIEEQYSAKEIIQTLKNMQFQKVKNDGYIPQYKRTEITDQLHEAFEIQTDYEFIETKKMKKIIKVTKQPNIVTKK